MTDPAKPLAEAREDVVARLQRRRQRYDDYYFGLRPPVFTYDSLDYSLDLVLQNLIEADGKRLAELERAKAALQSLFSPGKWL